MKRIFTGLISVTALAAAAVLPALAQHGTSAADRNFVTMAARGGTEEVRIGRAMSHSNDRNVRNFALMLVRDHTKANAQLKQLAQELGLTAQFNHGVSGAPAASPTMPDKQFVSHEVSDHQDDIQLFQSEAANGHNASLRTFARMSLPTLRKHLELAQRLSSTP